MFNDRFSEIDLGACCICKRRLSALHVDGATHAAVGPNVCTAVEPEMLLERYRLEHAIGVQFQRTAPKRGLEDMAHVLARAVLAGLHQKPRPFQGQKNATGERGHLAPAGRVPILRLTVECLEQGSLGRAIVSFDIDDVHPDVPFPKGAIIEARIGGVIDPQDEVWDQFGKQTARSCRSKRV